MNSITKKTVFGALGVAAAGALALGAAAPAMASENPHHGDSTDTSSYSSSTWTRTSDATSILRDVLNSSPVVVAPNVDAGGVLNGGILNGSAVASGNEVTAPVASGDDTSVASGNETPVGSGNDTAVGNGSGDGNSLGTSVSDLGNIDGMVQGILNSVDLNAILQGR